MACYHPIPGWYAKKRDETSRKRAIVFRLADGFADRPVSVPCGTCIGCLLEKARQWAVRCMHEASLWEDNCFLTLTYSPENLPAGGSLRPKDVVDFMKRLRFKYGPGIRFFQCGEYGEQLSRPHHHMLLFNHRFSDAVPHSKGLKVSAELEQLWPFGFSSIGEVTFESAGYVARYAMKKVKGTAAEGHYRGRVPEYLTMSRRPGIGAGWIDRFYKDVYPSDEMVVNGVVTKPPRYYDDRASKTLCPSWVSDVKTRRRGAGATDPESSGKRLVVREVVKTAQVKFLRRDYE